MVCINAPLHALEHAKDFARLQSIGLREGQRCIGIVLRRLYEGCNYLALTVNQCILERDGILLQWY